MATRNTLLYNIGSILLGVVFEMCSSLPHKRCVHRPLCTELLISFYLIVIASINPETSLIRMHYSRQRHYPRCLHYAHRKDPFPYVERICGDA